MSGNHGMSGFGLSGSGSGYGISDSEPACLWESHTVDMSGESSFDESSFSFDSSEPDTRSESPLSIAAFIDESFSFNSLDTGVDMPLLPIEGMGAPQSLPRVTKMHQPPANKRQARASKTPANRASKPRKQPATASAQSERLLPAKARRAGGKPTRDDTKR